MTEAIAALRAKRDALTNVQRRRELAEQIHKLEGQALDVLVEARVRIAELETALGRLASQEGFVGAAYIDPASIAWRELQLRADYAQNVLDGGQS